MVLFKKGDILRYQSKPYLTQRVEFIRYVREWYTVDNKRWAMVKRPHRKTLIKVEARKLMRTSEKEL